jgi:hypothetical protein
MKTLILILAVTLLTACASSPKNMQASHVSSVRYQNYSCEQIRTETYDTQSRISQLYASLKSEADGDNAQFVVGMLIFWPALFFLEGGDGAEAAEYSRLKGELQAMENASMYKSC